jgi:hypothetical protein
MFFDPITQYPFPKPPPASKKGLSKDQLEAITRERHALALEMRKFGYSYEQIAEHFETTSNSARGLVKSALENAIKEPAQEVIDLEVARLDQLYGAAASAVAAGDTDAITKCLAIMARRAKLKGLDAPEKKEVTGAGGGPIQVDGFRGLTDAELTTMKMLALKASTNGDES